MGGDPSQRKAAADRTIVFLWEFFLLTGCAGPVILWVYIPVHGELVILPENQTFLRLAPNGNSP